MTVNTEISNEKLLKENDDLKAELEQLKCKNAELEMLNNCLYEQIRLANARRFGVSSEKNISKNQITFEFFNEAEVLANLKLPEPVIEEITYKRKKRTDKRDEFYSNLPSEQIIYELPENEQICSECGGNLHACGVTAFCAVK